MREPALLGNNIHIQPPSLEAVFQCYFSFFIAQLVEWGLLPLA